MMSNGRNYAALPHEYLEEMQELSDTEFGRLCRALLEYSMSGTKTALNGNERFLMRHVYALEDRFQQKYDEVSATRREAVSKRWNKEKSIQTDTNEYKSIQTDTKDTITKTNTKTNTKTKSNNLLFSDENNCSTADVERAVKAWNKIGLNVVHSLKRKSERDKQLRTRIRDYGIDEVIKAFERIPQSDFLMGRTGDGKFIATFDWVIRPNNFVKVMEGNYDNRTTAPSKPANKYDIGEHSPATNADIASMAKFLEELG